MNDENPYHYVLCIYVNAVGLGYVLFAGPMRLADWGVRRMRGKRKNEKALHFVDGFFKKYARIDLVLEDFVHAPQARAPRIHALYGQLVQLAKREGAPVHLYTWDEVTKRFAHVPSRRYEIALWIAERVPELRYDTPPDPKVWIGTNARQALYDAAALGLTHYASKAKKGE
jgi:hypothetical protein